MDRSHHYHPAGTPRSLQRAYLFLVGGPESQTDHKILPCRQSQGRRGAPDYHLRALISQMCGAPVCRWRKSRVLLGEHSTMKVVSCVRRGVVLYIPLLTLWRMSAVRVRLPPTARDVLNNYFHFLLYVVWSFSKEMILCKIYQANKIYIEIYGC